MSKHRKQPERRYSHQAPFIASAAAAAFASLVLFVAGLATSGSATAADLLDPIQLAQAQKANCQLLASKATSTAQRTRANQCVTDQTRILQLLQSPSPTPPATTTPAPSTTQPPVTTAPPTTPPVTTPPATTQPPVTTPPATTVPPTTPPATTPPPAPGGFPNASNTGVPAGVTLINYSGPCTITSANTVIDARNISCQTLSILATGVVVKRSLLHGITGDGFRVEDSTIDVSPQDTLDQWQADGISATNFVALRVNVFGSRRGINCAANSGGLTSTVQDSWIHGTQISPTDDTPGHPGQKAAWHASALRVEIGCNIIHNTLACDWLIPTPLDGGCSADLTQYPDFNPVHHNTINGNLFIANPTGAAFCMYGGDTGGKQYSNDPSNATFIVVMGNTFQRGSNRNCAAYGPVDSYSVNRTGNVWSGNVWEDGGAVNP